MKIIFKIINEKCDISLLQRMSASADPGHFAFNAAPFLTCLTVNYRRDVILSMKSSNEPPIRK